MASGNDSHRMWGNRIAYKTWHDARKPALLALHGWLDNAASFDNLAPHLPDFHFIAPDLAGHGLSDFRSADSAYNLWQDAGDMDQLLREMDIDDVVLTGHSRGAMIATMLAALYPHRVRGLVLLDSVMPVPVTVEGTVEQLRSAFEDRRKYLHKPQRYYDSYDAAIQSRLRGPLKLSRQAADILATRGISRGEEGFYWRADPRLRAASEVKLTADHSRNVLDHVTCPALVILSSAHARYHRQWVAGRHNFRLETLDASHHLHLEATHGEVAGLIREFLAGL